MIYVFKCDDCNVVQEFEASMEEGPPQGTRCMQCDELMHRVWKDSSVHIPEHMRAAAGGDEHTSMVNRMKHASRPSGKKKVFY